MTFVDFQPSASSAEKCSASVVLSIPDEPGSIFGRPNGGGPGIGPGRTEEVFGGVADLLGERLVRVPPRARVFPVQWPLGL
jgi:hypothetical protein